LARALKRKITPPSAKVYLENSKISFCLLDDIIEMTEDSSVKAKLQQRRFSYMQSATTRPAKLLLSRANLTGGITT
jgi:hypothetical protein